MTITGEPSDDPQDGNHYEHFEYTNNDNDYFGAISASKKTLINGISAGVDDTIVIHLLVDYNLEALNAFYGYNLSKTWTTAPEFNTLDFKIFILG